MKLFKKEVDGRFVILVVLVVLFVVSGAGIVMMRHKGDVTGEKNELSATGGAQQSSKETKLYFTPGVSLPTNYLPGENLDFSFTIENQEGRTLDYPYTVLLNGTQVASHSINLKDNSTKEIQERITLPKDQQSLTIEIKLTNQPKTIRFVLNRA